MIPDIVEIKRLCASGQWIAKVENGKILLHDTVAGETVCIGKTEAEPVRHGRWVEPDYVYFGAKRFECSLCKDDEYWRERYCNFKEHYCPNCGAKMRGAEE